MGNSMKKNVLEGIKIQGSTRLSIEDISVLSLLYQPLISTDSFALFLTMYELVNNDRLQFSGQVKQLIHLTNFTPKELDDALAKLEAVGLLNSYYSKEKGYIFDLNHPLSPNEFLKDGSLGIYLFAEIGEEEFKFLQKRFKVATRIQSEFSNITRTFDEVFEPTDLKVGLQGSYQNRKAAILRFESKFDFELFESKLSKSFYSKKDKTDKLYDTIVKLAFTYDLNEEEMAKVYTRSLTTKGKLDYRELPKETRKQYQYRTEKEAPKLQFKMSPKNGDGLIAHLKSIQPKQLLQELSGMEPPSTELDIIYRLYDQNHMKPEVINLLMYYVLKINNGKMPNYTYFSKIANEWGRLKLYNIEDVYEYLSASTKTKSTKSKTKSPDWIDEARKERKESYQKDLKDQENSKDNIDLEAIRKFFEPK